MWGIAIKDNKYRVEESSFIKRVTKIKISIDKIIKESTIKISKYEYDKEMWANNKGINIDGLIIEFKSKFFFMMILFILSSLLLYQQWRNLLTNRLCIKRRRGIDKYKKLKNRKKVERKKANLQKNRRYRSDVDKRLIG